MEQNRSVETVRKFSVGEEVGFEHLIMVNQRLREEKLREEIKALRQAQGGQPKDNSC